MGIQHNQKVAFTFSIRKGLQRGEEQGKVFKSEEPSMCGGSGNVFGLKKLDVERPEEAERKLSR